MEFTADELVMRIVELGSLQLASYGGLSQDCG